jgi:Flp pilus assembly protein TadB
VGGTFTYGNKGESIQITKTVWIVPTAVIMAIVIAVVVIAILVLGLWLFLRNYKRRILKSSRRRY